MTDPFKLKSKSKLSPQRLVFTARARAQDFVARQRFDTYKLPEKLLESVPELGNDVAWSDTSVTRQQMQHLVKAAADTQQLGGCIVEVGCFRGVTTRVLSMHASSAIFAVDPFIGNGALDTDFDIFQRNIAGRPNVAHVRKTSGGAASAWAHGPASLVFIDAVHDYVNVAFDIASWWPLVIPGGIMAFHDTDDANFPGARRAVFELSQGGAMLYAHPKNLTLLSKPA